MKRIPLIPTMLVGAAIVVMVGLGVWQVRRAAEKQALIERYRTASALPPIAWPTAPVGKGELPLFRHATGVCLRPEGRRVTAGHNRSGESGYAIIVDCSTGAEGPGMSVEVGWSRDPNAPVRWAGGPVSGIIAPDRLTRMRLVAASAPTGLQPSAPPSIEQISNNHRLYAVQWFAFAALALVIYALALGRRFRESTRP